MSTIRLNQGRTPMPDGGTFTSNGYNLHVPSPVETHVLRPVPNLGRAPTLEDYQATLEKAIFGQKKTLTEAEKKAEASRLKYEAYDLEQQQLKLDAKKAGFYAVAGLGGLGLLVLTVVLLRQRGVAE